jgi:hypothetical protein
MPEPKELYISNLTETLRQSQRYLAIGFGASVFFALVVFAAPVELREIKAPIGPVEVLVSHNTALAISVAVYWVAGLLATFFIRRIDSIILLLHDDPDLVIAALMYPSVLTMQEGAGRLGSWFLPPFLVAFGMARIFGTALLGIWPILGMLLLLCPYLQLGWDLRGPLGDKGRRKRAEKLVLKHCANSDESSNPSVCKVVAIGDGGYIVRTVTAGKESSYMVLNVGENVLKMD